MSKSIYLASRVIYHYHTVGTYGMGHMERRLAFTDIILAISIKDIRLI